MSIELTDCPQVLRDAVNKRLEKISYAKIIAVTKHQFTPYVDKDRVETKYKAYIQAGFEFLIISTSETSGGSPLDGEISTNYLNAGDLQAIIGAADYIKEDIAGLVKNNQE
ncbi:hypothetical protein [Paenibacillus sp. GCM10027626]|uniref:hypothetical protein n=1 Tax=Paenibacillus sp. GCM10027626 TaxID=3273411 RepID=UPI003632AF32